MIRVEDLQVNAAIRGLLPGCLVTVVSVQCFGSEALEPAFVVTRANQDFVGVPACWESPQ